MLFQVSAFVKAIKKIKGIILLNMAGLSLGLLCVIFIALWITHELSFDKWVEDSERIFRVEALMDFTGEPFVWKDTPAPLVEALINDYPEVETGVRVRNGYKLALEIGEDQFTSKNLYYASGSFFDIFPIRIIQGDSRRALDSPDGIVISERIAKKYFGEILAFLLVFMLAPLVIPLAMPSIRENSVFVKTNDFVRTTIERRVAPSDVARRKAERDAWEAKRQALQTAIDKLSETAAGSGQTGNGGQGELAQLRNALAAMPPQPAPREVGETMQDISETGGKAIFWSGGVAPVEATPHDKVEVSRVEILNDVGGMDTTVRWRYAEGVRLQGSGSFNIEFLLYEMIGLDMSRMANATLSTLELPPKLLAPFLLMIVVSLFTRPVNKKALDRYYAKMKTPVDPDPVIDEALLAKAYEQPQALEAKKLFPGTQLEFQKPNTVDVLGVVISFIVCFLIIGLAIWMAGLGG